MSKAPQNVEPEWPDLVADGEVEESIYGFKSSVRVAKTMALAAIVYGPTPEQAGDLALRVAAAHDLYAACARLLDAIHDAMTHESQRHHADAIRAAFAALTKALGGVA